MNTSGLLQSWREGLRPSRQLCKRPEVFMIPWTFQKLNLLLIFTFYIISQVSIFNFQLRWISRYFESNLTTRRVWNSQNAKFPRLTSWRYVFNVRQTSVNKQRYWMGLRLARSNGAYIFTFPLRAFKWTSTFEMWFIPSWTNRFKPHPHTRHSSGLTSSPSNNVACLLTFAWRWTRIAMTLSAGIWRFDYSKPYVISDLIQNIWKTSQVRWKLKIDTGLII